MNARDNYDQNDGSDQAARYSCVGGHLRHPKARADRRGPDQEGEGAPLRPGPSQSPHALWAKPNQSVSWKN